MKVKLIKTNTYFNALEALGNEIKTLSRDIDNKNLIFTEEKMSLLTEGKVVSVLQGSFNTEVFSFIKYLKRKTKKENLLNKEGSIMLCRKIVDEKRSLTGLFKKGLGYQYAPSVYELISQLKSAKITPTDLKNSKENLEGNLLNKITDLAFIYEEYEKVLKEKGYVDQNTYLDELPEIIRNENLTNVNVFLVGFDSFTKQAKEIVKALVLGAKTVTAILVSGENPLVYTNETTNAFLNIVKEVGEKVEVKEYLQLQTESKTLVENIYDPKVFKKDFKRLSTDKVFIYEGETVEDEIDHVALIIKREVIEKGFRYKDFTIGIENADVYKERIESVFKDYDIPCFIDVRKNLSEHPIANLLSSYFKNLKGYFSIKELMNFARNPLFCEDKSFLDDFENYLYKYNIQRGSLSKKFTYADEEEGKKLEDFDAFREKLLSCFKRVESEDFAENYVDLIKNLFAKINVENKIKTLTESLEKIGEKVEASYNKKALDGIYEILEETVKLLGGTKISLNEFNVILISGIKAKELSIIPQFNDAVFVGDLKQCGLSKAKYLFVLGLTTDVPGVKEDISLLNDGDLQKLDKISLFIEPTIKIVNARMRESVCLGLISFDERLYLSYPATVNGKTKKKGDVIIYVEKLFEKSNGQPVLPINKKQIEHFYRYQTEERINYDGTKFLSKKQGDKVFASIASEFKDRAVEDFTMAASYYRANEEIEKAENISKFLGEINTEIQDRLNEKISLSNNKISASVLESHYACPYACFLNNFLYLKEREVGEVKAFDIGNYIHAILENYTKEINKVKDKYSSDGLVDELANKLEETTYKHFKDDAVSERMMLMARREAKRECYAVLEELKTSSFKITGIEKKFGYDDEKPITLKTKNGEVYLKGKIDRVDESDNYIRIIDYKTGNAKESNEELYMGKKVQLYLYMNALINENKEPAGVYYMPLKDNLESDKKELFFDGRSLNDIDAILKIDNTLKDGAVSKKIKATVNIKEGERVLKEEKALLSKETFNAYLKYALLISQKGAENITNGFIKASPVKGACSYCSYKGLCSFEKEIEEEREDKNIKEEDIYFAVKEEERS